MSQLRLLLLLYVRPLRAMSAIMDEGSLLFGLAGVIAVWLIAGAALSLQVAPASTPFLPGPADNQRGLALDEEEGVLVDPETGEIASSPRSRIAAGFFAATLTGASVLALVLLYAPFTLLLLTLFEPIGSFGVAFRRDFGPFLACLLMAWTAARLPVAVVALAVPSAPALVIPLWIASLAYFTALAAVASRVVFGVSRGSAAAAATFGWGAALLQPFLVFLASPFLIYIAYQLFRGDVGDVLWSFGARQSFRRYLAAATLNPRDADAHYQLGLIHLQRRQLDEAEARFRKAAEIDPADADSRYQLGKLARAQRRFEDARAHFEAVVSRDPRHASHEVWREIGATYLEAESYEPARWALAKFAEQRDHDPEGLYLLGMAHLHTGEPESAREMFRRCVEAVDTAPRYLRRKSGTWRALAAAELARHTA